MVTYEKFSNEILKNLKELGLNFLVEEKNNNFDSDKYYPDVCFVYKPIKVDSKGVKEHNEDECPTR